MNMWHPVRAAGEAVSRDAADVAPAVAGFPAHVARDRRREPLRSHRPVTDAADRARERTAETGGQV